MARANATRPMSHSNGSGKRLWSGPYYTQWAFYPLHKHANIQPLSSAWSNIIHLKLYFLILLNLVQRILDTAMDKRIPSPSPPPCLTKFKMLEKCNKPCMHTDLFFKNGIINEFHFGNRSGPLRHPKTSDKFREGEFQTHPYLWMWGLFL